MEAETPMSPMPPSVEVVKEEVRDQTKRELISELLDFGLSPATIASALNISERSVYAIREITHVHYSSHLAPEEQELAEKIRRVAGRAADEAMLILEHGTYDMKMGIIRSVLGGASRLIGKEGTSSLEEGRAALEEMFSSMRVDSKGPSYGDAAASAASPPTDDY